MTANKKKTRKRQPAAAGVVPVPEKAPAPEPEAGPEIPATRSGEAERPEAAATGPEPEDSGFPTRRDFLARTGNWLAGACACTALVGSVRLAVPDFSEGAPIRFPLGAVSDFKVNTLTWMREAALFVIHDERGLGAFSARCTHLGCIVRRTADGFVCPCHGARYDDRGRVMAGPARKPLPWYRVWLEPDGRLWVDVSTRVDGRTRSLSELSGVWPDCRTMSGAVCIPAGPATKAGIPCGAISSITCIPSKCGNAACIR
jgi:cytochrome b6-f complex iron-sulfur subunit